MNKVILLFSLLVLSTLSLTDKEILQQTLNGAFEENKLPDPTTIVSCLDDDTAHKVVVFAGQILDKAAKGSVSDLISIAQMIKDFGDQIPQSAKDCLNGNEEFKALGLKYGINDDTNSTEIEKKVITYVTLHYLTVHKWLQSLDSQWKSGKYYQVGFDLATDAHTILGTSSEPEITDKEILQQTVNGVFEQNKLSDPTTIVPCFDDKSAHLTVVFIGQLMDKLAKASVSDINAIKELIDNFQKSLPQSVKDCLNGNDQLKTLGLKYGIDDKTDPSAIEKKVIAYVTLHYLTVHKWLGDLDAQWKGGKYSPFGHDAADHAHTVLKLTREDIKKIVQE